MKYLYTFENNFKIIWCPDYLKKINNRSYPQGREKDALRASVCLFHCILHRKLLPVAVIWNSLVTAGAWFLQVCWGKTQTPTIRVRERKAGVWRSGKRAFLYSAIFAHCPVSAFRREKVHDVFIFMSQVTSWPPVLLSGFCQIYQFRVACVPPGCRWPEERLHFVPPLFLLTERSFTSALQRAFLLCYEYNYHAIFWRAWGWCWDYTACFAATRKIKVHWRGLLQTWNSGGINQKQQHFPWGWMVFLCICTAGVLIHHGLCVCSECASRRCWAALRIRGIPLPFMAFIYKEGCMCSYRGPTVTEPC